MEKGAAALRAKEHPLRKGTVRGDMTMNLVPVWLAVLGLFTVSPVVSESGSASRWIGREAPELAGGEWINSPPLSLKALRGKVLLLEFWTFGCYNCLNTIPYVKGWHKKYSGPEFEIIGIHTPEFRREKDLAAVRRRIAELGIGYPVVTDNDYATWNRYEQRYWPVLYLLDRHGTIRYVHIGEGGYEETEQQIEALLSGE
jgi:thiol-disulfide isomerase/thioredoxin